MGKRIENTATTSLIVKTRESRKWSNPDRLGTPDLDGAHALHDLAAVLREYGMEVEVREEMTTATTVLTIKHPERWQAGRLRNRGGGRTERDVDPSSPLAGLDRRGRLVWLEEHTLEEGCEALGKRDADGNLIPAGKATYYRRLKSLRMEEAERVRTEMAEAEAKLLEEDGLTTK